MCHCRHFVILFFTTARHLDLAQSLPISLHNQECSPFCIWSSSQLSFTFTQTPLYSVPSISLPSIQICTAKTNRSQLCLHSLCIIFKYFPLCVTLGILSFSILSHSRDTQTHINLVHILFICTKSCATPITPDFVFTLRHYCGSDQNHPCSYPLLSLPSPLSTYNVPLQAFHFIGLLSTSRTYIICICILFFSTESLFMMWHFRCFVLQYSFPHQGHKIDIKLVYIFFIN